MNKQEKIFWAAVAAFFIACLVGIGHNMSQCEGVLHPKYCTD